MNKQQRMMEKIKKLFALADNEGATVGEAANAMRMANGLLEKHNIDIMDLNETEQEETDGQFYTAQKSKWQRIIVSSVSSLYGCSTVLMGDIGKYVIIGKESDRVTAIIVITSLINVIAKAGRGKGAEFRNGAAMSIRDQVNEIRSARQTQEAVPGTGLILADMFAKQAEKNKRWLNAEFPNCKTTSIRASGNSAGREFGSGLSVGPRMSNRKALN